MLTTALFFVSCQSEEPEFNLIERYKGYPGYIKEITSHVEEEETRTYKYYSDGKVYAVKTGIDNRFFSYSGALTIKEDYRNLFNPSNTTTVIYSRMDRLEVNPVPTSRAEAPILPSIPGSIQEVSFMEDGNFNLYRYYYDDIEGDDGTDPLRQRLRTIKFSLIELHGRDSIKIASETRVNTWDDSGNIVLQAISGEGKGPAYSRDIVFDYGEDAERADNDTPNIDMNNLLFGPHGYELELFGVRCADRVRKISYRDSDGTVASEHTYAYGYDEDGNLSTVSRDGKQLFTITYYDENGK